ncbi:hypothetical protein N7481_008528 [Penicillium waksmanii]|uniref:uncharacterized protein n=1 Tax=Penicillium waksmanii TaxID=69791 RepID=UPI002548F65D|nr:uncharacterized protein N7481_008528 [Penicillium waksmanii]KAJ5974821.1 hypothetical protein N7481_008528 [Penicillium waksmanii]
MHGHTQRQSDKRTRPLLSRARKVACLPCRRRKIRCRGNGPPCGTCTSRKIGDACEYPCQEVESFVEAVSPVAEDNWESTGQSPAEEQEEPCDATDRLSLGDNTSTLSNLSSTPSLDFSGTDDDFDTSLDREDVIFAQPLKALPCWEMTENLKRRYLALVSPVSYS